MKLQIKYLKRAYEDAINAKGMTAGMPKAQVDTAHLYAVIVRLELLQSIAEEQASNKRIFETAWSRTEELLQQELLRLHTVIKGNKKPLPGQR